MTNINVIKIIRKFKKVMSTEHLKCNIINKVNNLLGEFLENNWSK